MDTGGSLPTPKIAGYKDLWLINLHPLKKTPRRNSRPYDQVSLTIGSGQIITTSAEVTLNGGLVEFRPSTSQW